MKDKNKRADKAIHMYSTVELYHESKMSVSQFCREMELKPHLFRYWLKTNNTEKQEASKNKTGHFLALDVSDQHQIVDHNRPIRITYPGGIFIEIPI